MNDTEVRSCTCSYDADGARFVRQCDYCSTTWPSEHCPHDAYQDQCPHCDVAPVVQLS